MANKLFKFGAFDLKNAWYKAPALFYLINKEWINAIIDPSNSVPDSVFIVIGENDFHKIFSQTLQAINNDIPDPIPYPSYKIKILLKFLLKILLNF